MQNLIVAIDELPYNGRTLRKGEEFEATEQHAMMLVGFGKAQYADDADDDEDTSATREVRDGSYGNRQERARPPGQRKRQRDRKKNQYERRDMVTGSDPVVTSSAPAEEEPSNSED